jgi:hypothetical protein
MSGESARKSVLIGLAFLFVAAGVVVWRYAGRTTARPLATSSADSPSAAPSSFRCPAVATGCRFAFRGQTGSGGAGHVG